MSKTQKKTDEAIAAWKRLVDEPIAERIRKQRLEETASPLPAFRSDEEYREQVRRWRYVSQYLTAF